MDGRARTTSRSTSDAGPKRVGCRMTGAPVGDAGGWFAGESGDWFAPIKPVDVSWCEHTARPARPEAEVEAELWRCPECGARFEWVELVEMWSRTDQDCGDRPPDAQAE